MKIIISILVVLFALPVYAQTYTETEFIVEGQPTTTATTCPTAPVIAQPQPGTTTVVTTTTSAEAPIYVGMTKQHVVEVIGQPTYVEKFKRFSARKQGIYDEVWTYQTPTGVTYIYIKERRVDKIEYR